jgi:hypothetical protein
MQSAQTTLVLAAVIYGGVYNVAAIEPHTSQEARHEAPR